MDKLSNSITLPFFWNMFLASEPFKPPNILLLASGLEVPYKYGPFASEMKFVSSKPYSPVCTVALQYFCCAKELEKIIEETEKEEKELQILSDKQAKKVEERLLRAYVRIRGAYKNGLAVVAVLRDACGGCYAKIPPQRQMEIRQRKRLITCEHCGRIMVSWDEETKD